MPNKLEAPHTPVFSYAANEQAQATTTVIVPLYNYADTIYEALDSVMAQTVTGLSLVVVDDCSTDASLARCEGWMQHNAQRFVKTRLVSHHHNIGLSSARNTGFCIANTPFVFTLDADNVLYPRCIERCEQALRDKNTAFVYTLLEMFGGSTSLLNTQLWDRSRLARGNYIDAMALIRKTAWQKVGGYAPMEHGWEDFDLWCSFAEQGWHGVRVPEILGRYRVHHTSMLQSQTNRPAALRQSAKILKRRHSWLNLQH